MIVRRREGRRLSEGGRDHLSHRLVYRGLSDWAAVALLVAVSATCAGIACGLLAVGNVPLDLAAGLGVVVILGSAAARLVATGPKRHRLRPRPRPVRARWARRPSPAPASQRRGGLPRAAPGRARRCRPRAVRARTAHGSARAPSCPSASPRGVVQQCADRVGEALVVVHGEQYPVSPSPDHRAHAPDVRAHARQAGGPPSIRLTGVPSLSEVWTMMSLAAQTAAMSRRKPAKITLGRAPAPPATRAAGRPGRRRRRSRSAPRGAAPAQRRAGSGRRA